MPTDAAVLGFENQWQAASIPHASRCTLPSGALITAASPPYLFATKLEAFTSRGRGDLLRSHDFEDLVVLVDGRAELVEEVRAAPADARSYIAERVAHLLAAPRIDDGLAGAMGNDAISQERVDDVVLPRLRALAGTV